MQKPMKVTCLVAFDGFSTMRDLPSFKATKRCNAHCVKKDKECGRKVTHGLKCWFHSQIYDGLRVKKSNIPNAGRGLFAATDIPSHTLIAKFKGPTRSESEVEKLPIEQQANCVPRGTSGYYVDASKSNSCYARYANEAKRKKQENAAVVDVEKRGQLDTPALESEKRIKAGTEIDTDYGKGYPRDYPHWRKGRQNYAPGYHRRR